MVPQNIAEDLCMRFLEYVPTELQSDDMRVLFEIELAHWFYIDHYCSDPSFSYCKPIGFKDFARFMFKSCSYLKTKVNQCDAIVERFYVYKNLIPTNGAILIDKSLEYVLLVQGYFAQSNSWGFPKGKVNEGEKAVDCACREAMEEVGYDIKSKVRENRSLSKALNKSFKTQLFLVFDCDIDFAYKPHVNKEIRKIQWFKIDCLPTSRHDYAAPAKIQMKPNNFYNVVPFVNDIRICVEELKRQRRKKHAVLTQQMPNSQPILSVQQLFARVDATASSASEPEMAQPSISTLLNRPSTIMVYVAPVENNGRKSSKSLSGDSQQSSSSTSPDPNLVAPEFLPNSVPTPSGDASSDACVDASKRLLETLKISSSGSLSNPASPVPPTNRFVGSEIFNQLFNPGNSDAARPKHNSRPVFYQ